MEKTNKDQKTVFVTGATGFLASHCIKLLLQKGYKVISSTRSLKNPLIKELQNLTPNAKKNLKIVEGNLEDPECWKENLKDCDYLFHLASPVFLKAPEDENKVLNPAINGTINVLEAAVLNNIKKVVVTSSIAAVKNTEGKDNNWYTPEDFTDINTPDLYCKSKVRAEKKAWELFKKYKGKLNLSIICPGIILDETLTSKRSPCNILMKFLFNIPLNADMYLPIVSAKDCAVAHLRCLEFIEETKGKRYILVENTYSTRDLVQILKSEFGKYGYWFFKIRIPNFLFWITSFLNYRMKGIYLNLGRRPIFDNDNVKEDLGVPFENHRKYFLRTISSMIKEKKLKNRID